MSIVGYAQATRQREDSTDPASERLFRVQPQILQRRAEFRTFAYRFIVMSEPFNSQFKVIKAKDAVTNS